VLLADQLAPVVDAAFVPAAAAVSFGQAWTGAAGFTFQLFLDFSAYSEMAIGLALMFGLWLPENFQTPYRAADLRDFWRRWHITLSRFLRDYIYVPLGGSRHGFARYVLATMITMTLCGLWHGAGWTFVAWGAMHGVGLVVCAAYRTIGPPLPAPIGWALTMLFVIAGWVMFRSPDFGTAWTMLVAMAGLNGFDGRLASAGLIATAAAVSLLVPSSHDLANCWIRPYPPIGIALAGCFAYLVLRVSREQPVTFIYFQF
jgi:D-alanyl-lipoteichoic acid acyltransferase DltB (MBOAT superfamily)